jgi:hypothetical protein
MHYCDDGHSDLPPLVEKCRKIELRRNAMDATDPSSAASSIPDWRELYTAALFETDKQKLPARMNEAERRLIQRSRELFAMPGDNIEEKHAVDDALYALRALRSCLKLNTNEPDAT